MRKFQENQIGLKLNGTHQLLVHADMNLLGDDRDTIQKNIETLLCGSKQVGLKVNEKKTIMLRFFYPNANKNHDIKRAN
jgi:hypothetical protein